MNNNLDLKSKIKRLVAKYPIKYTLLKDKGTLIKFRINSKEIVEQVLNEINQSPKRI